MRPVALAVLAMLFCRPLPASAADQPNIIAILTDDQRADDLCAPPKPADCLAQVGGDPLPTIRALADNGISFTQHYNVMPLCAPARASMLTGKRPSKTGVRTNGGSDCAVACGNNTVADTTAAGDDVQLVASGASCSSSGTCVVTVGPDGIANTAAAGDDVQGINVGSSAPRDGGFRAFNPSSTVAVWLHDAHYRTGLIGKYLNNYRGSAKPPGWDTWKALVTTNDPQSDDDNYSHPKISDEAGNLTTYDQYSTYLLRDFAMQFIAGTEPFFLWFAPKAPHAPATPACDPPPGFCDTNEYQNTPGSPSTPNVCEADMMDKPLWLQDWKDGGACNVDQCSCYGFDEKLRGRRLATLLAVDRAVAAILGGLGARINNTVILFTSDNGYSFLEHWWILKTEAYEEDSHLPLIVKGPGYPVHIDTHLVSDVDIAPTLGEIGGATVPTGLTGRSFLPLLKLNPPSPWRTELLLEWLPDMWNVLSPPYEAVVADNGWKYIRSCQGYSTGGCNPGCDPLLAEELYDLNTDPYELTSQHANTDPPYPSIKTDMQARLATLKAGP